MIARAPIAVFALCAVGLAGCLVPYPIEERPLEVNYPPFIVAGTLTPSTEFLHEFDPRVDVDGVLLRAAVDDPNASNQLFFRWFINYNEDIGAIANSGDISPGESQTVEYLFRPCLQAFSPNAQTEIIHRIDLLVSDRAFLQAGTPANQSVPSGAQTLQLTWFVRLDSGLCQ